MKRKIKALLSGMVVLALTLAMLGWLTDLTERKDSDFKNGPFLTQEADYDVLFFGSSHMIYGVYPMELWQDHGIVSYNLAGHGIHIPITYWVMKNALLQTKPKLVVVDCYMLQDDTKMFNNFSQVHQALDVFPLTMTKLRAAFDLLHDNAFDAQYAGRGDRTRSELGLLWDFSQYHNRWTELGPDDFTPKFTVEKGANSTDVNIAVPRTSQPTDEVLEENTASEYLRRIVEDCQRGGIDVLLVYLPFPPGETERKEANTARMIAREYGVDYIDFLEMDTVDFTTDCYDNWSHLNPSGARKVTDYLGQYIRERYGIPDRRDDAVYAGWFDDYAAYTDYKLELLAEQTELKNYLVLMQDRHMSACLYLRPSNLWGTEPYRTLLENMGVDSDGLPTDSPAMAVVDRDSGAVLCLRPGETAAAGFGTVCLAETEGTYSVTVDGRTMLALSPDALAGAVAVDAQSGRSGAAAQFSAAQTKLTG